MGLRTLENFRNDLQRVLGARAFAKADLQNWVNAGYLELTAAFDFQELLCITRVNISAGVSAFDLPPDLQTARVMSNLTDSRMLIKVDHAHFLEFDPNVDDGVPTHWALIANSFRIWPAPDATRELRILYGRFPAALTIDSQQTELRPTWDRAVHMFAANQALLDLNEEARAADWLARAVSYVRSRLLQEEFADEASTGGVGVATQESDLTDLRT